MNQLATAVALLFLTQVSCSLHRREEPEKSEATKKCEELCKMDAGMDGDATDCLTECAVSTDLMTHHLDEGADYFVRDESYNEKGGQKMTTLHNEKAPEEVPKCTPEPGYEAGTIPQFDELDTNKDGVIDSDEAIGFSEKACIPDEMIEQIFSEGDLNQDKVISKKEWESAGENTVNEVAMDNALEGVSEGDDEYNSVQNPPMTEFDKNNDGSLDKDEAGEVFEHEVERRTEHEDLPEETQKELEPKIEEAIDKVDTNDDGVISGDEYSAETDAEGMGEELKEAAAADEDKKELDDLSRVDAKPAMIAQRHSLRHSHGKGVQRKLKYAEGILAEAKLQQRLRKAMFLQHQRRLRQAVLSHKKAKAFRHRK